MCVLDKLIIASTDFLVRRQVIDENDRDVYEYGFHALYNNIIDITSIAIISVCLNQVLQTILYHLTFVILRNTAGGFHAKTHLHCFIMSTIIWLLSLWGISQTTSSAICIGLAGLSVFLVWAKAPIEHINSPLGIEKYKRMRLSSRIFSAIYFVIVLCVVMIVDESYIWVTASLAYGMVSHALLMLIALSQAFFRKG